MSRAVSARKLVERAQKMHDKNVSAVFACAPNMTTRFLDCLKLATPELRASYEASSYVLDAARADAVARGKAYRG